MQITPDDLLREAADMALELRIKDRVIAGLQAENERLRGPDGGHSHSHGEHEAPAEVITTDPAAAAPQGGGD